MHTFANVVANTYVTHRVNKKKNLSEDIIDEQKIGWAIRSFSSFYFPYYKAALSVSLYDSLSE